MILYIKCTGEKLGIGSTQVIQSKGKEPWTLAMSCGLMLETLGLKTSAGWSKIKREIMVQGFTKVLNALFNILFMLTNILRKKTHSSGS